MAYGRASETIINKFQIFPFNCPSTRTPSMNLHQMVSTNVKAIRFFLEARNIRRLQKHGFAVTVTSYFAAFKLLLRTFISSMRIKQQPRFSTDICFQFANSKVESLNPNHLQGLNTTWINSLLTKRKIVSINKANIEVASSPVSVVFSIIGFVLVLTRLAFEPHRLEAKSAFWIWFRWYHQVINAVQLSELNNAPIIWENLDEPPTNVLGSMLTNRLIGLHGPASIEVHNYDQEVDNVIFRYSWQWKEAQSLVAFKLKRCAILKELKVDRPPHLSKHPFKNKILFVSSGYWLREELGMLFKHEVKPAEIETRLKRWLCDNKRTQAFVIPHPRELQFHEISASHYERLGLQLSTMSLASILPILSDLDSISIIGGTSTAFSCFPDQYPELLSRTRIIVEDSTIKSSLSETSLGQMFIEESVFFDQ